MWNQDELKLPDDWTIYQQITIIDGSTFELYVQNMKPLLGGHAAGIGAGYREPVRRDCG